MLDICAGGGYAAKAALTEYRIKALGTVVAGDMSRANHQALPAANAFADMLAAISAPRKRAEGIHMVGELLTQRS